MINEADELISFNETDWSEHFDKLGLFKVFGPLLGLSEDPEVIRGLVKYISWTYTKGSSHVLQIRDWLENKKKIFEDTFLHHDWINHTVHLKDETVLTVINNWISYQDQDIELQIITLKDLKLEMQISSLSQIKKGSGTEIDYDQKMKNAEYVIKLHDMIKEREQQLMQHDIALSKPVVEAKKAYEGKTVGVEKYVK